MNDLKRVAVTGLGVLSPLGHNVADTWKAMTEGVSGAGPITHLDVSKFKTQFACEIKDFDISLLLDKKEARKVDPFVQYALWAAAEAMRDAAFDMEKENANRMGCIWGSGMGGLRSFQESAAEWALGDGTPRFNPFIIPKLISNIAAGHISIHHGLKGPNYATNSACAASSHAIADAFNQIRWGKADVMIAGGSEAAIEAMGIGGFNAMHALSTRNDDPLHASRPFSKSRDGFILGEGAACVVLEEMEHAKARGAKIYAEMAGEGMTADAYHITAPDPEGEGAQRVMRLALEDAGISPQQVDYINAHGTSTPLGDIAELNAISKVFAGELDHLLISSTKSMTGHLLGAAGAIEAVASILTIHHSIIPPTINHSDDDIDEAVNPALKIVFNKALPARVDYAISNTFGFGGHNACLVFKKYEG